MYVCAESSAHVQNATLAPSTALEELLGNDDDVPRSHREVLVFRGVVHDVVEVDLPENLFVAVLPDEGGATRGGKLGEAARQRHQLQDAERLRLGIRPGLGDLAHDENGARDLST